MKRRVMIEYDDAAPGVRAVYDDVLKIPGMTELPNWIKALGSNENVLKGAWTNYKSVVLTGDVPLLLKQLILFVISMRRGNRYCSASHGHTALSLDPTLTCDDLYSLARGEAFASLPPAFKAAIDTVTSAALDPQSVESGQLPLEQSLRTVGFSDEEIDELMGQAELGLMMNAIMSIWDIPAEKDLPPPTQAITSTG